MFHFNIAELDVVRKKKPSKGVVMIDWESAMAKKWLIEDEPVLLRDILPAVMAEIYEKTNPNRSDVISFAKYYESRLAAQQARAIRQFG